MLPNEMLAAIFEAGARSTFQDDRGLPFIITVSHVCQHWRAVAYSFPNAWCCIPVHMKRDAMTELFLARSEGHLLQICIHFRCSFTPHSAQWALTLVEPSAPRWTRLCIRSCNAWRFWHHTRFGYIQGLVRLRALELRRERNGRSVGPSEPLIIVTSLPMLESVESVTCVSMGVGYHSPILHGLTRLSLAHLPRPSHEEFRQLCSQNPHLEYLKLEDVYPILYQSQHDADQEWGSFVLNSLRTLDIVLDLDAQDRVGYVERFLGALTVPALCELSFKSKQQLAWESLGDMIWNGDLVWDHLRTLHFIPSVNFRYVADPVRLFCSRYTEYLYCCDDKAM